MFILIFETGQFIQSCKKWEEKITEEKNWVTFKLHFTKAHKRLRKPKAAADNAGYGSVNNALMQETSTHLENLETNTSVDRNVVSSLSETSTSLVAEISDVNATLAVAVTDITALRVQLSSMDSDGRGRGRGKGQGSYQHHPGGRGEASIPRTMRRFNNTDYCFSFGYDIQDWYNGESYPWKKANHATDVTRADNKEGSQKIGPL